MTLYREAQQKLKDLRLYSGQVNGVRSASYVRALGSSASITSALQAA